MFYFKLPDLASPLYTQLECYATTGACIGEAKQAALNEFIMQKQSFFLFLHGSCYLLFTLQTWRIEPLTIHSKKNLNFKSLDVACVCVHTSADLHFYGCWEI